MTYTPKPKEFFIERIGKRIFRDKVGDCCADCDRVVEEGLIVSDEFHADSLACYDADYANEQVYLNYRDFK